MIQLTDLLVATGGRLHGSVAAAVFDAFCYDSRLAQPGQLFIAVKTERADGHAYIRDALGRGVTGVLCQQPPELAPGAVTCVVVPDTRLALQAWARHALAQARVEVIGVTGSVGKTTTKEAIAASLGDGPPGDVSPVFRNRANYNGLYGLPIALGELRPEQRIAVLEMAADHFGEVARLCEIAPPRIGVVTTVEPAHLATFGTLEAIAREKAELIAALPAGGLAVLNADDPRVAAMASRSAAPVVTFGIGDTGRGCPDVCATDLSAGREGLSFTVHTPAGRGRVQIPLLGRHQVYAALAAFAVSLARGIDLDVVRPRLTAMPRVPGRLYPLPGQRGSLLLDDSYSSSPAAAEAALDTLASLEGRRKIAVLGDMLELGEYEAAGHEQVGRKAAGVVDLLVTKGERGRQIADAARAAGLATDQAIITYTADDAARAALAHLGPGDIVLVKGSLAARMEQIVRLLMAEPEEAAEHLVRQDAAWQQIVTISPERPTWLEIDLAAIAGNVRRLKALAGDAELLISLKADAYGHGAVHVAHTSLLNGASWLGVATFTEGLALRRAGITAPILVLGYTPAWQARDLLRHDLTATVFDLDVGRAFSRASLALDRPARVHVKVDTGMARLGVFPGEAVAFVKALRELPALEVQGIFTHLSVADSDGEFETEYTRVQLDAFRRVLDELAAQGVTFPLVHAVNSAGLLRSGVEAERAEAERASSACTQHSISITGHTLVRAGIAVYGLDPSPEVRCPRGFRPALAWKTQIAQVKELPPGSYVGYGATYRTTGRQRIAVIPVGYADGFRRAPHHWGEVLVRGQRAAIVGRVSMDQTMIDVTHIAGVRQGDEVVLIGRQSGPAGEDQITAEEVARRLGTINYEVVSAILPRVPRETHG
jgi:Alr-MurF fusion protein